MKTTIPVLVVSALLMCLTLSAQELPQASAAGSGTAASAEAGAASPPKPVPRNESAGTPLARLVRHAEDDVCRHVVIGTSAHRGQRRCVGTECKRRM